MADTFDIFKKPISGAGSIINDGKKLVADIGESFKDNAKGFMKAIRARTIPTDGEPEEVELASARWSADPEGKDWRVKLSLPPIDAFTKSKMMTRLIETGGLAFPYTPTIIMSHQASYNALTPVHSNYPFFTYQNSSVDAMTLTGQFIVQNALEGEYWIGMLHYLRSITKMFYGAGADQGAPPPIVKLNGYGDYVFKDVPVIITNFTLDMPTDVDYVAVNMALMGLAGNDRKQQEDFERQALTEGFGQELAYVPVDSTVTVTLQPIYSRDKVEKFSLGAFARGDYIGTGKGYI